ncbi:MAG: HPr family phosphocarrier protein [Lachnospiraceae bacterium]|nr:HPr family phosphocarrier protein [Lachnospiraceae bacterium]
MKTVKISIDTIEKVKDFVTIVNEYPYDFDLVTGRYVINAKSIMGIFSLDISKPLDLNIRDAGAQINEILESIKPFIIEADK